MKKTIATFVIAIRIFSAGAHPFSAFNLKMFDNGNFSVVLDNKPTAPSTVFSVAKIKPGYHNLKVFRLMPAPYFGCAPMQKIIYSGWITIPGKSIVYAQINCHGQYEVMNMQPYFPPYGGYCDNGWNDNGWSCNNTGYYNDDDDCGYVPAAPMCMSPYDFMGLKAGIENKTFESSKIQMAKQAIAYNNFTLHSKLRRCLRCSIMNQAGWKLRKPLTLK
jgi:hypothetical protein